MTSLLSAKKRAEEFAAVVDGGADESTLHPELVELVGVVGTLQRQAQAGSGIAPQPEFTATLRERLMAEAATSLASDNLLTLPVRKKGPRERRIALVASSLVLVGGTAGMAAAAQNALPGEALYPIKRGLENAQAGLATSPADRGKDLLGQAESRLDEVRGLYGSSDNLSQVPGTIDDFERQATEASVVLIEQYQEDGDATLVDELRTFAADNLRTLQELAKSADAEHQDELASAADVLMGIDSQARAVCPTCASDLGSLELPTLFLTANEAREAMDAADQAKFDNSHPILSGEVVTEDDTTKASGKDEGSKGGDDTSTGPDGQGTGGNGGGTGGSDLDIPSDLGVDSPDGKVQTPQELLEQVAGGVGSLLGGTQDGGTGGSTGGSAGDKTKGQGDKSKPKGDKGSGTVPEDLLPEELEDAVDTILP